MTPSNYIPAYHTPSDEYMESDCFIDIKPEGGRSLFGMEAKRTGITCPGYPCHPVYRLYEAENKPIDDTYYVYQAGRFWESGAWHAERTPVYEAPIETKKAGKRRRAT